MKRYFSLIVIFILPLLFMGCTSLLPSRKIMVNSSWKDFNDTKLSYEKIIPGETTVEDLKKLGFDPYTNPNVKILTVTDIMNMFLPNPSIKIQDLAPGVRTCIESMDGCTGYQIGPAVTKVKRVGNFWLDLLSFKRHEVMTGWDFRGLITIIDNVVNYRDPAGGRPFISRDEIEKKPLGFLQGIGDAIGSAASSSLGHSIVRPID